MATKEPTKASSDRVVLGLSLLALAVVAATAFGRIFQGKAPAGRLALAAAVAVVLAVLLERRAIGLATLVSAAGLAVAIGLLVFPDTTRYGLPTLETFRLALHSFGSVSRAAAAEVAPAQPLPPLFLAALTAVWTASFASHTLATRARSPFLALLPPAALLAFGSLIVRDGARPPYVLGFMLAALAVLFADALRRVMQWGPVVTWRTRRSVSIRTGGSLRSARRVTLACVVIALFAPWILPGFKHPGIVDVRSKNNASHVSLDPLVDIRPQLLSNPAVTVFRVKSSRAAYWRTNVLDRFTGERWLAGGEEGAGLPPNVSRAGGGIDPSVESLVTQRYVFDRLAQPWLPAAASPLLVGGNREPIEFDQRTGLLLAPNGTSRGFSYDVTSVAVSPSPIDLDALKPFAIPPGSSPLTELPPNTPREIFSVAHRLTDRETSTYRKILAIQDYLLSPAFTYSEHVKADDSSNAVVSFLTKTRTGYCQQFAGTMAVLLRSLGIPARVAIGYTAGKPDPRTGTFTVSTTNAHAWVEVLFPKYGWLAFEPTPGRTNPVASPYVSAPPARSANTTPKCLISTRGPDAFQLCNTGSATPAPSPRPTSPTGHTAAPPVRTHPSAGGPVAARGDRRLLLALGAFAVLVLVVGAVPGWKAIRRRRMLSRASGPTERALAAYRRMAARAADLGLPRLPAETIAEYRVRLRARVSSLDGDLDRLTWITGRAAYSDAGVSPSEAEEAVRAADGVARQIRRAGTTRQRLAGWFRIERPARRR